MNKSTNNLILLIATLAGLTFAGCDTPTRPAYTRIPNGVLEGSVSVATFKYLPAIEGKPEAYGIRDTGLYPHPMGISMGVAKYVATQMSEELWRAGVRKPNPNRILNGEIEDFFFEHTRLREKWTLRVHYFVTDQATGKIIYDNVKVTQLEAWNDPPEDMLDETIWSNIDTIIEDPAFVQVVHE